MAIAQLEPQVRPDAAQAEEDELGGPGGLEARAGQAGEDPERRLVAARRRGAAQRVGERAGIERVERLAGLDRVEGVGRSRRSRAR